MSQKLLLRLDDNKDQHRAEELTRIRLHLLEFSATHNLDERTVHLQEWLPLPFVEASHLLASITGLALVVLAHGLWRRVAQARVAAIALLLAGAVFSIVRGLDWDDALLLAAFAALLHFGRAAFYRHGNWRTFRPTPRWFALIFIVLACAVVVGLFAYRHVPYRDALWWEFAWHGDEAITVVLPDGPQLQFLVLANAEAVSFDFRPVWAPPGENAATCHPPSHGVTLGRLPDAIVIEHPRHAGGHLGAARIDDLADPRFDFERVIPEAYAFFRAEGIDERAIPLVPAGGINSHERVRELIAMGAAAVQLGTAFAVTSECDADAAFKDVLAGAGPQDIVEFVSVAGLPARAVRTPCLWWACLLTPSDRHSTSRLILGCSVFISWITWWRTFFGSPPSAPARRCRSSWSMPRPAVQPPPTSSGWPPVRAAPARRVPDSRGTSGPPLSSSPRRPATPRCDTPGNIQQILGGCLTCEASINREGWSGWVIAAPQ
mgnify:CR=1 FL=1